MYVSSSAVVGHAVGRTRRHRRRRRVGGADAALAELGVDGVRLRPAVTAVDLPFIVDEVVPLLQRRRRLPNGLPRGRDPARSARPAGRRQPIPGGEPAMNVPLSILDLAPISAGSDAATALRNTVDLAQHAEQWGYRRYWIAEHHFVAVASSSPAVLIGQIAAATHHIRVGAAAVQLGHTTARRRRGELRHARRVPPRPHRPRGRPVGAAQARGGQAAAERPRRSRRGNGARSTASWCRRRST